MRAGSPIPQTPQLLHLSSYVIAFALYAVVIACSVHRGQILLFLPLATISLFLRLRLWPFLASRSHMGHSPEILWTAWDPGADTLQA